MINTDEKKSNYYKKVLATREYIIIPLRVVNYMTLLDSRGDSKLVGVVVM